jgi:hypothetical protein
MGIKGLYAPILVIKVSKCVKRFVQKTTMYKTLKQICESSISIQKVVLCKNAIHFASPFGHTILGYEVISLLFN